MEKHPNRPFESLDWYRDAARHGFTEDRLRSGILRRMAGTGFLRGHVSIFAVVSVALLVINLLRTPDNIWANRWIAAWAALLVIHGVVLGILWAIRQWNAEDEDEAVDLSHSSWKQTAMFGWGAPGVPPAPEPQETTFRAASPPAAPPQPASPWANWNVDPQTPDPPPAERASWSEASPAAWLGRRTRSGTPEPGAPARPDPEP